MDVAMLLSAIAELLKAIAWPGTVLITLGIFKNELRELIPRLRRLSSSGADFSDQAREQSTITEEAKPIGAVSAEDARQLMPTLGPATSIVVERLRKGIKESGEKPSEDLLLVLVAKSQVDAHFFKTWGLIFGSQLRALKALNNLGPQRLNDLHAIYGAAARADPEVYKAFPFQNWLDFLVTSELALVEGDRANITTIGQAFLSFLPIHRLMDDKPF